MIIQASHRADNIKEYYFSLKLKEIARINQSRPADSPIINLGIGAPDGTPPASAIEALTQQAARPDTHAYQSYIGIPALRKAMADWYQRYYGVSLNPETQIQPLVGSKEGILLLSLAFLDEGDKVLVPDPGYPTYTSASRLAGAEVIPYDLLEEKDWEPDFEALEKMDLEGVKIMWCNYPNMPTGGKATAGLFQKLVDFGNRHQILICHDNPYSFILTEAPLSIMAAKGAQQCALELNSLSKAHNMSGWRIGMVVASPEIISTLLKVKSQMDSGMFRPLQLAAVEALQQSPEWFQQLNATYRRRKRLAQKLFDLFQIRYHPDSHGLFLWGKVEEDNPLSAGALPDGIIPPQKDLSRSLGERVSDHLLYRYGVFFTPGFIFGKNGQSYVRISLCTPEKVFEELIEKFQEIQAVS